MTGICVTEADKTRPKDFEIFQFYAWVLVTFPLISESEREGRLLSSVQVYSGPLGGIIHSRRSRSLEQQYEQSLVGFILPLN